MYILAIDSSTYFLSVAVSKNDKILSSYHRFIGKKHSSKLFPVINSLLKKSEISLKNLDAIAISIGPGSFTGLRIGVAAVKGFAFGKNIPIVKVPTLDIIAHNGFGFKGTICPILDAKKNNIYSCIYSSNGSGLKRKSGYSLMSINKLLERLKGDILFLGDAIPIYKDAILKNKNTAPKFAEQKLWYPDARIVCKLATEKFVKEEFTKIDELEPMYLYSQYVQISLPLERKIVFLERK